MQPGSSILASEGSILTSEGWIEASRGWIEASGGYILASRGVLGAKSEPRSSPSRVFMLPGGSHMKAGWQQSASTCAWEKVMFEVFFIDFAGVL